MAGLERRLNKLEKKITPHPFAGKHSLQLDIKDGERCDVALTKALDEKGITLDKVSCITFFGGIHVRPMRDLKNHPEWEQLERLNKSQRIFQIVFVSNKEEWQEYQLAEQEEQ